MTESRAEPSIFERIAAREIPAQIVAETDRVIAFHDIAPKAPVHVVVTPKNGDYRDVVELAAGDPGLLAELVSMAGQIADELAVQAATELGVDAIVPWAASRSISRWEGPKAEKGRQRWATIVREAVKQSIRSWLPSVSPVATTAQLAERLAGTRMLLLEPTAATALSELEADGRDLALVVGPEGGIAPGELELLVAAGAEPVRLGASVLRTSTAGPAAIAVLNSMLGRW